MNIKAIPAVVILLLPAFLSSAQGLPEKVNVTFKKLYPGPGSTSYSLYDDFYEIGYHDANGTGGFINVLIDVEGNHIGTISDKSVEKEKETELKEKLGVDCSSPAFKVVETPGKKNIYYVSCYYADEKGEKTTITLAEADGKLIRKGSVAITY